MEKQLKTITWHGLPLPVYAQLNSHGQPCSVPHVRIEDMPQDLRRDIEFWATKIRAEPMLIPPPGCAYTVEDFAAFEAWFAETNGAITVTAPARAPTDEHDPCGISPSLAYRFVVG